LSVKAKITDTKTLFLGLGDQSRTTFYRDTVVEINYRKRKHLHQFITWYDKGYHICANKNKTYWYG